MGEESWCKNHRLMLALIPILEAAAHLGVTAVPIIWKKWRDFCGFNISMSFLFFALLQLHRLLGERENIQNDGDRRYFGNKFFVFIFTAYFRIVAGIFYPHNHLNMIKLQNSI